MSKKKILTECLQTPKEVEVLIERNRRKLFFVGTAFQWVLVKFSFSSPFHRRDFPKVTKGRTDWTFYFSCFPLSSRVSCLPFSSTRQKPKTVRRTLFCLDSWKTQVPGTHLTPRPEHPKGRGEQSGETPSNESRETGVNPRLYYISTHTFLPVFGPGIFGRQVARRVSPRLRGWQSSGVVVEETLRLR